MTVEDWSSKSDLELVLEFKSGQEDAFRELMKRYKEKAMQITFVTVGNYEDAKDASQEAFVKAHQHLSRFEMRSEFATWFYRILINSAKDLLRRRKWQRFLRWKRTEDMDSYFEKVSDPSASPSRDMMSSELGTRMSEVIKKLPFQQQWMFTLRHLKGFSIQQIADVAEVSEGTVKATLHFANEKFKREMTPYLKEGNRREE